MFSVEKLLTSKQLAYGREQAEKLQGTEHELSPGVLRSDHRGEHRGNVVSDDSAIFHRIVVL
jgi:hypothetical protein